MDPKIQQILAQYPNCPPQIAAMIAAGQLPIWAAAVTGGVSGDMQSHVNGQMGAPPEAPAAPQAQAPDPTMALQQIEASANPAAGGPPQPPAQAAQSGMAEGGNRGGPQPGANSFTSPSGQMPAQGRTGADEAAPTPTTAVPNQPASAAPSGGGSPYGTATPGELSETRFGSGIQGPGEWAQRAFLNAQQDQGTNLYDPTNAHSPFGSWLQSRYIPEVESKLITGRATGAIPEGGEAAFSQGVGGFRDASLGGGSPAGGSPFAGLLGTAEALGRFSHSDTAGMNSNQTTALGELTGPNGTGAQAGAIMGALRGPNGGWGMGYAQQVLDSLQRQYANNPAQNDPSGFMQAALSKLNIH